MRSQKWLRLFLTFNRGRQNGEKGMSKEKSYSMKETMKIGDEGMSIVRHFLETHPSHINFFNVEKDKAYQNVDIDFLWTYWNNGQPIQSTCELKTDTYKTQNFFFETHSNLTKGTPGCFMYTEAKFLFYYFINKVFIEIFLQIIFKKFIKIIHTIILRKLTHISSSTAI